MTASISTTASKTPSLLSLGTNPLGDAVPKLSETVSSQRYRGMLAVHASLLTEAQVCTGDEVCR